MQHDLAETRRILETQGIDVVRLIYSRPAGHAAVQGPARLAARALGRPRPRVLRGHLGDDHPRRRPRPPRAASMTRCPDMVSKLDTDTIRPIPWLPGVAYAIADIDNPDGSRSEIAPRAVLRSVLDEYEALGLTPICGPGAGVLLRRSEVDGTLRAAAQQDRPRLHDRSPGRPRRPLPAPPALPRPAQHRRLRRQPRVLPVAVRDQPVAQRGHGRRRPHVPVQDGDQGRPRLAAGSSGPSSASRGTTRAAAASTCTSPSTTRAAST